MPPPAQRRGRKGSLLQHRSRTPDTFFQHGDDTRRWFCVIINDDCTTAELQHSACETHTGIGPHRCVGGYSDTNCIHTLHCYWRFQDWQNLRYSWPKEEVIRCGDGGCCLHGTFYSNPALHHGCTMLPRGKGYWRMNISFLSDPSFLKRTKENWE